jgi:hypothetical protein
MGAYAAMSRPLTGPAAESGARSGARVPPEFVSREPGAPLEAAARQTTLAHAS